MIMSTKIKVPERVRDMMEKYSFELSNINFTLGFMKSKGMHPKKDKATAALLRERARLFREFQMAKRVMFELYIQPFVPNCKIWALDYKTCLISPKEEDCGRTDCGESHIIKTEN